MIVVTSYTVNPISYPEDKQLEFDTAMHWIVLDQHFSDLQYLHRVIEHFPDGTVFELKIHKKEVRN